MRLRARRAATARASGSRTRLPALHAGRRGWCSSGGGGGSSISLGRGAVCVGNLASSGGGVASTQAAALAWRWLRAAVAAAAAGKERLCHLGMRVVGGMNFLPGAGAPSGCSGPECGR